MAHNRVASHQAAFANMSNMVPFVRVLNAFAKDCPYLEYATCNELVNTFQKGLLNDSIPASIYATDAHGTGDGDDNNPLFQRASGPNDFRKGAHQNSDGTNTLVHNKIERSDDNDVPTDTDSTRVIFESTLEQERSTPPKGRLQWVQLTKTMILGVISSLLHQRMRVTDLQRECGEQTCR